MRAIAAGVLVAVLGLAAGAAFAAGSYAADFTETRTLPGMSTPLVLHGHLEFTPGQHLLWEITRPYHYRFAIRDGRIAETLPDGTQEESALEKTPWAAALFSLFTALFSGDAHALARYFVVTPQPDGLVLMPRSEVLAKSVKKITTLGTPVPRRVTIEEAGGSETLLDFTATSLPAEASAPAPAPASAAGQ